jgi:hypothetical protein
VEKFAFFHRDGLQILAYVISGMNGSLAPGDRKLNWVWYWNCGTFISAKIEREGDLEHRNECSRSFSDGTHDTSGAMTWYTQRKLLYRFYAPFTITG